MYFHMKRILLFLIPAIFIINGCGPKYEKPVDEAACASLYEYMQSWYLWNDSIPEISLEDYADPYELMQAIKCPSDKWSAVSKGYEELPVRKPGSIPMHCIRLGLDQDDDARVITIYTDSDLYSQGVRRGWKLITINGASVYPLFSPGDDASYNRIVGAETSGIINSFEFEKADGTIVTLKSKKTYSYDSEIPVLFCDTLHLTSGITGYLAIDNLDLDTYSVIRETFEYFKSAGVTDFIVDLRYCSGDDGYGPLFSSYIAGNSYSVFDCMKVCYNDIQSAGNYIFSFSRTEFPLNIKRPVFITSRNTSGQSELMISALKGYMDVTLIGDDTFGNFFYTSDLVYDNYRFSIVILEYKNAKDEIYYNGIPADIRVTDDMTHDFGDRKEACLATAIDFLEN